MRLKNTTDYPDWFLRRMVSWVRKEIGVPAPILRETNCTLTKTSRWRGRAWRNRILIRVCTERLSKVYFPYHDDRDGSNHILADRTEALIVVTAHEIEHVLQNHEGRLAKLKRRRRLEPLTRLAASRVLAAFRERRAELEAAWYAPPALSAAESAPSKSIVERRAAHARKMLAQWERKQDTAKKRVASWRKKVKYYDGKGV